MVGRVLLALAFLAVATYAINDIVRDGCDTDLCCEECAELDVARIIDGDTFVAGGSGVSGGDRVRLYGMDTPEVGERCYREATDRLRELAGDRVRVEPGPRPTDRFGRLLYYVYTGSGASIDAQLVQEGLAIAWRQDGQHRDYLVGLETQARREGTGCLW